MNPYLTKNKFIKGFFLDQAVDKCIYHRDDTGVLQKI